MNSIFVITAVSVFGVIGVIFLVAPTLRPRIAFGRTVAEDFATSPDGRHILRSYRFAQLALLALLVAAFLAVQLFAGSAPWSMPAFSILYVAVASTIWTWAFRRTRPHAVRVPLIRTAELVVDRRIEFVHLAALLPLPLTALILALAWSRIPASFPMHWNAAASPNNWAYRSIPAVFSPLWIAAVIIVGLWAALRYATPGTARMRWILPSVAWYVAIMAVVTALLPLRTHPEALPRALLFAAPVMILLVCGIAVAVHLHHPRTASEGDGTPDERWIGGIFYANPQDPALFVEKRMGIGWTLNFGRPGSWFIVVGIWLFVMAVLVLAWFARH
jgi:uncharacterized membrane protein